MKKMLLSCIFLVLILCSCNENFAEDFNANVFKPPNYSEKSKRNFHYGGNYTAPSPYITTADGLYEIKNVFPNSANIFYYDFETLSNFFLCEKPECVHNNSSCTSFIELHPSEALLPLLLYSNEKLFLLQSAPSSFGAASIIQMDKNGANKSMLLTLKNDESFDREFVFDNENIYFIQKTFNTENYKKDLFCQYNLKDKKIINAVDLPSNTLTLCGFSDENLYFLDYRDNSANPTVNLYAFNPSEENELHVISAWNPLQDGGMVINEHLYLQNYETNKITLQNLQTNEISYIETFEPLSNTSNILTHLYANKLLLESVTVNESGPPTVNAKFVDFTDKSVTDFSLKMTYNNYPVRVIGEYSDKVCVIKDFTEKSINFFNDEGLGESQIDISREYALVSKEDCKKSNPSYLTFTLAN